VTAAHVVQPDDEKRHRADADDLWNESYYCDFVATDPSTGEPFGGWLRLGLYPNRDVAWWTTWIVRPGTPGTPGTPATSGRLGICSVDYHAPVPPGDSLVSTTAHEDSRIEIDVRRPLEEFRLAATAPARSLRAPSDAYDASDAEQTGDPATLGVDLTWTTDGVPYHYDLTTRYEIPCLVAGTVTIDGETIAVQGHGQRDHSWGVRDWWAFGWCWCSMRLDDGTRIHLADIRMMPGVPVFFGYIQMPGEVHPATSLTVSEVLGEHDFPTRARIEIGAAPAHDIGIDVTPVAFGPVLLRDEDAGRTSRFPRAMLTCRTDDGRTGSGWIEWNQPQDASPPRPD
jgi:hypothetical protein